MEDKINKIKERILQLAKYKGVAYEKFCDDIGMTYGNFKGKSKETPINSNAIANILTIYPETNLKWLITGNGPPLKIEHPDAFEETYPPIPFYPDVMSIGGTSIATTTNTYHPEQINPGAWFPGATAAIRHYGDSMQEYPSGSILILKEVNDLTHGLIPGQNYVLEYGNDWNRITKRIQKKGKHIIAHSTNPTTYPDGTLIHQPFKIIKIHRAWHIIGCIIKMENSNGITTPQNKPQKKTRTTKRHVK